MPKTEQEEGHFIEITETILDILHEYSLNVNPTHVGVAAVFSAARFNMECIVASYREAGLKASVLAMDKAKNIDLLIQSMRQYLEDDYDTAVKQVRENTVKH